MSTLIVTRGLPGSGKTTRALAWVAEDPERRVRINRDALRIALHGGYIGEQWAEDQVTGVQEAAIERFLDRRVDVICDDTNLPDRRIRGLRILTALVGAQIEVWDLRDVPLALCLERNAARPLAERVPEVWIRAQHTEHIAPMGASRG